MDLLYGSVQMRTGFVVHIHHHGTEFGGLFNILFGMHNHEMHIQRLFTHLAYSLENRKTERDIGHEHAIHDVHMQPICLAVVNHFDFVFQVKKVGCQQ